MRARSAFSGLAPQFQLRNERILDKIFPVAEHRKALVLEIVLDADRRRRACRTAPEDRLASFRLVAELERRIGAWNAHGLAGGDQVVGLEIVGKENGRDARRVDADDRQIAIVVGFGLDRDQIARNGTRLVDPHTEADLGLHIAQKAARDARARHVNSLQQREQPLELGPRQDAVQKPSRERRGRPLGVRQLRQERLTLEPGFAEGCLEIRVLAIAPRKTRTSSSPRIRKSRSTPTELGGETIAILGCRSSARCSRCRREERQHGRPAGVWRSVASPGAAALNSSLRPDRALRVTREAFCAGLRHRLESVGLDAGIRLFDARKNAIDTIAGGIEERKGIKAVRQREHRADLIRLERRACPDVADFGPCGCSKISCCPGARGEVVDEPEAATIARDDARSDDWRASRRWF